MKKQKLTPIQLIVIGFAIIILLGALLLCLPSATKDGHIDFVDALFTSTSATCVTGLVIFDTYTKFTLFGQIVIITLIQTGGLGFVTLGMFVALMTGRKLGLKSRMYLAESVSLGQLGGVVKYTRMILLGTFTIEGIGAILLSIKFIPIFGVAEGIWCGIFHSISAFCNAGFDILGALPGDGSLSYFADDTYVIIIITTLIILGGIGFFVWDDIKTKKLNFKKYRLHTKIMLTATVILLVLPTAIFMVTERNGQLYGLSFGKSLLASYFHTVTLRTAGFYTTDYMKYSPAGYFLSIILMIIGAGAGSTGGGMKVTTFVVAVLSIKAYITGKEDIDAFGRRLSAETVRKAAANSAMYMMLMGLGAFIIMLFSNAALHTALFEAASAIGTVGLSSGLTASLPLIPKITVMLLMYSGRVGSMSIAMSVANRGTAAKLRLPEEEIIAG